MFKFNWHIVHDKSNMIWDMMARLYVQMYHDHVTMLVDNCNHDVIDDVTMSKNRQKFWTTVTSLIYELERRSKVQNVENSRGYQNGIFYFSRHFWRQSLLSWPQNFVSQITQFSMLLYFDIRYRKNKSKLPVKIFSLNDVPNDVAAWLQSRHSMIMSKWNYYIFHENPYMIWDTITKLYVQMYWGYVTMLVDDCGNDVIDDVIMSKNKSKFWTTLT